MKNNGTTKGPVAGVVDSLAELSGDMLEILELQIRLAGKDAHETLRSGLVPGIILIVSVCALLAALPVLAFSLASLLHSQSGLPEWAAELIIGLLMLLAAVGASIFAILKLQKSVTTFRRSASELSKNVAWLKGVARRDNRQ